MIIAAGQGATAAQAIERDLFDESLRTHRLRRCEERYPVAGRALS
jgi:thioredoxin reductase (NADPH)